MFFLKKLLFKFMELGLGMRTCFTLETRNPIFLNFRLDAAEAERVRAALPPGFELQSIHFTRDDDAPAYWVSYNLYEIAYPKKELAAIRKARCEINTFVTDATGRPGVYVFSGSPFVSREEKLTLLGKICDLAERAVIFIYGCGKLTRVRYRLDPTELTVELNAAGNSIAVRQTLSPGVAEARLSDDYLRFNDISFFNRGRTFDLVNVNSAFLAARFEALPSAATRECRIAGPFVNRAPDRVYFHRGDISYLVESMNRNPAYA
jgi:hypothetical protein